LEEKILIAMRIPGMGLVLAAGLAVAAGTARPAQTADKPIRVVIWDEQQASQKTVYANFLGNEIAEYLKQKASSEKPELSIKSVRLDDPEQGISKDVLDNCDVLVWWGHQRHGEIKPEKAKEIVERVKSGQLSLVALHSAHWSKPFIEAMNERTRMDALKSLSDSERRNVQVKEIQPPMRLYRPDEPHTPSWKKSVNTDGSTTLEITLPSCVFSTVKADAKPSHVRVLMPKHPIMKGVPEAFDIPQTEVYGGHFHVPTPDAVLFEEKWDSGDMFTGGCLWKLGKGQVFYFRPGHETYPVFKQAEPLRIVENAIRYVGKR
jgi:trehalose utilization protein